MCNFFSAIAISDGTIRAFPEATDSHSDLIEWLGLKDDSDNPESRQWCRIEFTPQNNYCEPSTWALRADEEKTPIWFDDKQELIRAACEAAIRKMIVTGKRKLLLGGCWILGEGADIERVVCGRIFAMCSNAKVGELRENSKVGELWENSQVGVLRENSQVGEMRENSKVGMLWGNSKVGELWGNSKVGELWENSQVGVLRGNSQVGVLRGNSKVGELWGNSKVGEMRENSKVGVLWENSQVGEMRENSQVEKDFREKTEASAT